jgi:hypothetical protein
VRRRAELAQAFRLPPWVLELAREESLTVDATRVEGELRSAGVTGLTGVPDENRPTEIWYTTPTNDGWVDVLWDAWESPIVTALNELSRGAATYEQLRRMHIALTDMELVAIAARELARHRHTPGDEDAEVGHDPYWQVSEILEAGLVVVYARSFTGKAKLGGRWRPQGDEDLELHNGLLEARGRVHAHADFVSERTLINTTEMFDMEGPPVYAEARTHMSREELEAIAVLCDKQRDRFYVEAGRLKVELGSPVAGSPTDS